MSRTKKPKKVAKYLWLDLETTGLDHRVDRILECAMVATTGELCRFRGSPKVEDPVLGRRSLIVYHGQEVLSRYLSDFTRDMHTRNGLLAEIANFGNRTKTSGNLYFGEAGLEDPLHRFVDQFEWELDGKPVLAGATIHFDRDFIRHHIPRFEQRLHHRHLDVSSLKLMSCDVTGAPFAKAEAHRAMADIYESLGQAAQIYREFGEP